VRVACCGAGITSLGSGQALPAPMRERDAPATGTECYLRTSASFCGSLIRLEVCYDLSELPC
jgi:hypothetical protein